MGSLISQPAILGALVSDSYTAATPASLLPDLSPGTVSSGSLSNVGVRPFGDSFAHMWDTLAATTRGAERKASGSSSATAPNSSTDNGHAPQLVRSDLPTGLTSNLSASVFGHALFDAFDDFSTNGRSSGASSLRPLSRSATDDPSAGNGIGSGGVYSPSDSSGGGSPAASVSAGNLSDPVPPPTGISGASAAPRSAAAEGDPPTNGPPLAANDSFAVASPGNVTITPESVLANDSDPDGDPLIVTFDTSFVTNGTVIENMDGSLTYTPDEGYVGIDHIGYTVADSFGLTATGDIEIIVNGGTVSGGGNGGGGEYPWAQASPDEYTFESAAAMTVTTGGVLSNDEMSAGPFTAALLDGPSNGTVSLGGDGTFTYTPNGGSEFTGSDSFTYQLVDGLGTSSNAASVVINVNAPLPAEAPWAVANPDVYTFDPGVNLTVASGGVLSNDAMGGGSFTATLVDGPSSGAVSLNGDGTFSYSPAAGSAFTAGSDTFTYQLVDGWSTVSNVATVTILVNAPPPADTAWAAAAADEYSFEPAVAMSVVADGVMSNDGRGGGQFTVALVDAPSHGTILLNEDGTFTYTPDSGAEFTGTDTFTYQLVDSLGAGSNTATVTITVAALVTSLGQSAPARAARENQSTVLTVLPRLAKAAPQANPDPGWSPCYNYGGSANYYWVTRGGSVSGNVLSNDCDNDGPGPLRVWTYSQPGIGGLVMGESGAFTYTPPVSSVETGTSFTYQAYDGAEISGVATVNFYFRNTPNVRPWFDSIPYTSPVNEDSGPNQVAITGITAGEEDQTVSLTATSSNATVIPNPIVSGSGSTRTLTFTPAPNRFGTTTITVIATDDGGMWNGGVNTFSQSFTMTVNPVNDRPSFYGIQNRNPATTGITETVGLAGLSAGPYESQTVTLSATTDRPDLVTSLSFSPSSVFVASPSLASANLSYFIPSGATGTARITVKAQDNGGTDNGGSDTELGYFNVSLGPVVTIQRYPGEDNASEVGPRARSFLVDRGTNDTSQTLYVKFATVNDGGQGIATHGADYTFFGSTVSGNTVTIPSGVRQVALAVGPIPDALEEGTEQVVLGLQAAQPGLGPNYNYSANTATISIEDQPTVWMSQADPDAVEGGANTGSASLMGSVRFYRSGSAGELSQPLTVSFTTTSPPPASMASYGAPWVSDYGFTNALTSTSITIPANQNSVDLVVAPYYDGIDEGDADEVAKIVLANASAGEYIADHTNTNGRRDYGTVNIEDVDPPKVWMSPADTSATEGAANTGDGALMGSVRFHRHGDTSQPLTVNFLPGGNATYGAPWVTDYGFTNALTSSSITIPAGAASVDLVIAPYYDNLYEGPETAYIYLTDGTGYTIDWATAVTSASVLITNVDPLPTVASLTATPSDPGIEENAGVAIVSATLSNRSVYAVSVPLNFRSTCGGSEAGVDDTPAATLGVDYNTSATAITIPAGSTTGSVALTALADTLDERNEFACVDTGTAVNATVPALLEAAVTIFDNNAGPAKNTVWVSGQTKAVEGGEIKLKFTRKTDNPSQSLNVSLRITDSTASPEESITFGDPASAVDFDPSPMRAGTPDETDAKNDIFVAKKIKFLANETEVVYTLEVNADNEAEGLEGFQVEILEDDKVETLDRIWKRLEPKSSQLFGGRAVTVYIVDGIVLYAKDNSKPQLVDNALATGNPGIHWNDVNQGGIGDCFVMATLAAIARTNPNLIQNSIQEPNAIDLYTYHVRLYRPGAGDKWVETWVPVTLSFANGYAAAEFSGDYLLDGNRKLVEVWPQVMELAISNNMFGGRGDLITGGGLGVTFDTVVPMLTGQPPEQSTAGTVADRIRTAFGQQKAVMIPSQPSFPLNDLRTNVSGNRITLTDPVLGSPVVVVASHAYAVVGVAPNKIQLFDPRMKSVSSFWVSDADINNTGIFGQMATTKAP
ncbi:MAG: tandem-95 repeat protein [Planctomycetales bacterium]|nr:tandem-95 repeat protein [Planctomycetales bacterium]